MLVVVIVVAVVVVDRYGTHVSPAALIAEERDWLPAQPDLSVYLDVDLDFDNYEYSMCGESYSFG